MAYKTTNLFAQEGPALDNRLEYLYLRRSILDHLIRSLELYQDFRVESKPPMLAAALDDAGRPARQLAS